MKAARPSPVAERYGARLDADPARVIAQMFVAGQEGFDHEDSRANAVLRRVLAMDEADVDRALDDVIARFERRHRNLADVFARNVGELSDRVPSGSELSTNRRLLLGATFTSEYAIEGAAVCNPSIVAHPDQSACGPDELRFVMSVRCIGEGHLSSIGFRTGVVDAEGRAALDEPAGFVTAGDPVAASVNGRTLRAELAMRGQLGEDAEYVLEPLGREFTKTALDVRMQELRTHRSTRAGASATIKAIWSIVDRTYAVTFPSGTAIDERALWPATPAERHGVEDARFVRFTTAADDACYLATYTAYDGSRISQQLLETRDFASFSSSPLVGDAAANKGVALFPRMVGGRYAALSRCDRETNSIAFSDDVHHWPSSQPLQVPTRSWELLQLGNCGSPIETAEGWLVLTHGVGPMRTYSIGAILLDLDDPTVVIGALPEPLLAPAADERDGYVPNVVYSCGSLVHAGSLVLPYGMSDGAIGFASASLDDLLGALRGRSTG